MRMAETGMDIEFLSGVVVSYSRLLREMSNIRKDIRLILDAIDGRVQSTSQQSTASDGASFFLSIEKEM